jgi:hypothetical protein
VARISAVTVENEIGIGIPTFGSKFRFRVPIGDYRFQLNDRIRAVFQILPEPSSFWLIKRSQWPSDVSSTPHDQKLLNSVFDGLLIRPDASAILFPPHERNLVEAIAYLVNRLGESLDRSLFVIPMEDPQYIIDCCAHPESIFVSAINKQAHDDAVMRLRSLRVPAFGPNISNPYIQEPYSDIIWMGRTINVDRKTGKVYGPGSDESSVLPEFQEPTRNIPNSSNA